LKRYSARHSNGFLPPPIPFRFRPPLHGASWQLTSTFFFFPGLLFGGLLCFFPLTHPQKSWSPRVVLPFPSRLYVCSGRRKNCFAEVSGLHKQEFHPPQFTWSGFPPTGDNIGRRSVLPTLGVAQDFQADTPCFFLHYRDPSSPCYGDRYLFPEKDLFYLEYLFFTTLSKPSPSFYSLSSIYVIAKRPRSSARDLNGGCPWYFSLAYRMSVIWRLTRIWFFYLQKISRDLTLAAFSPTLCTEFAIVVPWVEGRSLVSYCRFPGLPSQNQIQLSIFRPPEWLPILREKEFREGVVFGVFFFFFCFFGVCFLVCLSGAGFFVPPFF